MKNFYLICLVVFTFASGCKNNTQKQAQVDPNAQVAAAPKDETLKQSLKEAEIPFEIQLPEGTLIKSLKAKQSKGNEPMTMLYKDFDGYYISIIEKAAIGTEEDEKKSQLSSLKKLKSFGKLVKEDANGFIYQIKNPGEVLYGFVYVKNKDGISYVFQQGNYQLEGSDKIESMYNSVKDSK